MPVRPPCPTAGRRRRPARPGRAGRPATLALAVVAAVAGLAAPSGAAPTPTTAPPPAVAGGGRDTPWLEDPRVDPALGGVTVDSLEFKLGLTRYRTTQANLAAATRTRQDATARLADEAAAEQRLVGTVNQATRRREKSATRLEVVRADLQQLAVDDYVRGAQPNPLSVTLDPTRATDLRRVRVLVTTVRAQRLAEEREHSAVVAQMDQVLTTTNAELAEVRGRIATDTAVRDGATADEQRFTAQLATDAKALADARLTGQVSGLDLSFVALDAYVKAAHRMQVEQPTCAVRWTLLAGVGRTESRHGTYNGTSLDADGNERSPIIGIALDGSGGTAAVGDTDGGALDGDPTTDRAVGPMQFIPGTWRRVARDGNGDGKADPQNMYDAALTAAAYLCRQGPGLDTDEGMLRALRSYNNDAAYGQLVLERAKGYDQFTLPPPPRR